MINKTELRIGNKVLLGNDIVTVKEIGEFELSFDDGKLLFTYDRFKPIPLSPEILKACGFKNIGEPFRRWISDEIGIDITEGEGGEYNARFIKRYHMAGGTMYAERNGPYIEMIFCPNPIKHLHQLTNFWHSITGSELSINLEKVKA